MLVNQTLLLFIANHKKGPALHPIARRDAGARP